jgi:hypothetical protein
MSVRLSYTTEATLTTDEVKVTSDVEDAEERLAVRRRLSE